MHLQNNYSLAHKKVGFVSFLDGSSPGMMGAQVLLLVLPELSQTSRGIIATQCPAQKLCGLGAGEVSSRCLSRQGQQKLLLPYCSAPPLKPLLAQKDFSVSFLRALQATLSLKLTLRLYGELKCYPTICSAHGKHNGDCASIRYNHNKYNPQTKSSPLLRIRSTWNNLEKKSTLFCDTQKMGKNT